MSALLTFKRRVPHRQKDGSAPDKQSHQPSILGTQGRQVLQDRRSATLAHLHPLPRNRGTAFLPCSERSQEAPPNSKHKDQSCRSDNLCSSSKWIWSRGNKHGNHCSLRKAWCLRHESLWSHPSKHSKPEGPAQHPSANQGRSLQEEHGAHGSCRQYRNRTPDP